ncbi:hypothetical protein O988_02856, partial [Pseudogymnoascus sp. VKM F-3808]
MLRSAQKSSYRNAAGLSGAVEV